MAQIPKQQARPWGDTRGIHAWAGRSGWLGAQKGRGNPQPARGPGLPGGAGTSCSASSWYRAVCSSSRRCLFTTSSLEAAPSVVPTHLYRKFCSKARGCGCADPRGRGSAGGAVGKPGQRPLHRAGEFWAGSEETMVGTVALAALATGHHEAAHRPLPGSGRAVRDKRQTRAASDTIKAQEIGPKDHVQKTPAGCPPHTFSWGVPLPVTFS